MSKHLYDPVTVTSKFQYYVEIKFRGTHVIYPQQAIALTTHPLISQQIEGLNRIKYIFLKFIIICNLFCPCYSPLLMNAYILDW